MADSVTFTDNSFVGNASERFILDCISENRTVQEGHIYVKTGFNKKLYMPRLQTSGNVIQTYSASPSTSGGFTITERELPLTRLQVYVEFHPNIFRDFWEQYAPSFNQLLTQSQLPPQVLADMTSQLVKQSSFDIATAIWQGDTDASPTASYPNDFFNGIIAHLEDESGTIDVSGAATITSANVIEKLGDTYEAIPNKVIRKPDMKIFVSTLTARLMQSALEDISGKGPTFLTVNGIDDMNFRGIKVVALDEFPDDTMVACESGATETSNLRFGATNIDNHDVVRIDRVALNSELYFMKMIFAAGTEVAKPDECVLYKA